MPRSILVVDDARAVRALAKQALAPLGATVTEATNGYNALFAMEKSLPDLVVLDNKMPVMEGLELLMMMRSAPALAKIPVVMLTSPADHRILDQLRQLGVSAILTKPLSSDALLAAAQEALQ